MDAIKEPKRRGRPPKPKPAIEGAEFDGQPVAVDQAPASAAVEPSEGLDAFLARVDAWQHANHSRRIGAATFPGADKLHSNVFNGFMVTHGPAGVTLSTGETIEI
jgi:hypothetical protein